MILAAGGGDFLYGGAGNDDLVGALSEISGIAIAEGGEGNDFIQNTGSTTTSTLCGGDGVDMVSGGNVADVIYGGYGADLLYGGEGNDANTSITVGAGALGNDTLDGGAGNAAATMYGDAGDDIIFGGFANDTIYGGANVANTFDFIGGYYGNDNLYGGTGTDGFNLVYDVRATEFDFILDWGVGGNQDQIYVNLAYASSTTWTQ